MCFPSGRRPYSVTTTTSVRDALTAGTTGPDWLRCRVSVPLIFDGFWVPAAQQCGGSICSCDTMVGSCLHLELLHGLLGLGNVDPIVVAAHLDSLLTFFFGKDTGFHGKSAFSFRNHSFSRIPNQIQVKVRKSLQILTVSVFYLAEWNFLPQALLRDMP